MSKRLFLRTFGYATVEHYQEAKGLKADGIIGPKTKAKMKEDVVNLQAELIFRGAHIACDGILGDGTIKALKRYQKAQGWTASGTVGPKTKAALYKDQKKGYVGPHFKRTEFKCECGGRWCNGYNGHRVSKQLVAILEQIRREIGKPVHITSGIRCQRYNDSLVGSIPNSVHRLGGAADVYVPGVSPSKIRRLAYKYGAAYSYCGTANMGNACHINV